MILLALMFLGACNSYGVAGNVTLTTRDTDRGGGGSFSGSGGSDGDFVVRFGPSPTPKPLVTPSPSPTASASATPTPNPSVSPVATPSGSPSPSPSVSPIPSPTPTVSPSPQVQPVIVQTAPEDGPAAQQSSGSLVLAAIPLAGLQNANLQQSDVPIIRQNILQMVPAKWVYPTRTDFPLLLNAKVLSAGKLVFYCEMPSPSFIAGLPITSADIDEGIALGLQELSTRMRFSVARTPDMSAADVTGTFVDIASGSIFGLCYTNTVQRVSPLIGLYHDVVSSRVELDLKKMLYASDRTDYPSEVQRQKMVRMIQKILVHELGHALGLGHSPTLADIMYRTTGITIIPGMNAVPAWLYPFAFGGQSYYLNTSDDYPYDDVSNLLPRAGSALVRAANF